MTYITPTEHNKAEWSRLAHSAYAKNLNSIGHRYSVAATLYRGGPMALAFFDQLQEGYRLWLNCGFTDAAPFINQHVLAASVVEVSNVQEYGLTQKLSNSIRCF